MVSIERLRSAQARVDELDYRFNWPEGLFWAAIGSFPGAVIAVIASLLSKQSALTVISLALLIAVVLFGIFAFVLRRQLVATGTVAKRHAVEDLEAIISLHEKSRTAAEVSERSRP